MTLPLHSADGRVTRPPCLVVWGPFIKGNKMLIFANLPLTAGESGLTLKLYNPQSGTQLNAPGDAMQEMGNGVFYADVTQDISGDLRADVLDADGDAIASDWLYEGNSVVGLARTDEEPEPVYTNVVRRNADDDQPLYFEWPTPSESLTAEKSINGGAYEAIDGVVSYLRTEAGANLYTIAYEASDRPTDGTAEYKVTSGTVTRIIPLSVDTGGGGDGSGLYQLTVYARDIDGNGLAGARVNIDGTGITLATDTLGKCVFNVDPAVYLLNCSPPAGYETPVQEVANVLDDLSVTFTLAKSTDAGCHIPWVG